nr:homeobox protein engrailed-1-like [Salvelinus alpinus]
MGQKQARVSSIRRMGSGPVGRVARRCSSTPVAAAASPSERSPSACSGPGPHSPCHPSPHHPSPPPNPPPAQPRHRPLRAHTQRSFLQNAETIE